MSHELSKLESTARPAEPSPTTSKAEAAMRRRRRRRRRSSSSGSMPSEEEIEEFFAAAETKETKQFADKYNYDVAKDAPLEGRYEWIRVDH